LKFAFWGGFFFFFAYFGFWCIGRERKSMGVLGLECIIMYEYGTFGRGGWEKVGV
jgi:hypothetical protein